MKNVSKATCQRCGEPLKYIDIVDFILKDSKGTEYTTVKGVQFDCPLCGVIHTVGSPSIVITVPKKKEGVICP